MNLVAVMYVKLNKMRLYVKFELNCGYFNVYFFLHSYLVRYMTCITKQVYIRCTRAVRDWVYLYARLLFQEDLQGNCETHVTLMGK